MKQEQTQEQQLAQSLRQTQSITQQQLLQAQLIEMPMAQLRERIHTEMDDNPALESAGADEEADWHDDDQTTDDTDASEDYEERTEREERSDALDAALEGLGRDDEELPVYHGGPSYGEERGEMVYGETLSFYDQLKEQMGLLSLNDRQRDMMEYLIGSLDDDGLLRKSLDSIADELAIYHNISTDEHELQQLLRQLQDFDPAGIGARSLQECLLLQIRRREPSRLTHLMEQVAMNHFDAFTKKHWQSIRQALQLSELQTETLIGEMRKLNPKPGAAMGEAVGRSLQQVTPDFIVETQDDGTVTFQLNTGELPELHVSPSFAETLHEYQTNKGNMSRQMKEALLYTKKKVDAAHGFIEAVKSRRRTLMLTMRAIIQWQHRYFEEGDEALLRPMILKDIAEKTGLDLSTISRASNGKYAQTRWGTFPLRHFFSDGYVTTDGDQLSTREIKMRLRDLIRHEDKRQPLSDDALCKQLAQQGFPIARRTVAKYREQLGLPVARLRKEMKG